MTNISFFTMHEKFRLEVYKPASSKNDMEQMKNHFKDIGIPDEYSAFVSQMTEAEILVMNESYIRIWGAEGCIEMNDAYHIQKYIPNSLAIGDNEGGKVILYASGKDGYGLYQVGFGDLDINDAEFISSSLTQLLIYGIGADKFI
ncbi:SMI1/KNR4 family protein [Citrobacter enshiensis]|uniref:SMI1/KNR4 family protein n=1 Tax=Citrobacter enshiensis TaxID=2971264 RepID=UPI0023E888A0|nr:SMI1/KNR4 family protein [Citrobacter enshiensis]WET42276.1 SMI1/KNR4 family protein [Citrobacter enshiensis]